MGNEKGLHRGLSPKWFARYEAVMVIVGVVGPFATVPQLYKLYFTHPEHAVGQSLTTWSLYALLSFLWFFYGLVSQKPAIYLGNGIATILNFLMTFGILLHAGLTL